MKKLIRIRVSKSRKSFWVKDPVKIIFYKVLCANQSGKSAYDVKITKWVYDNG